MKLQKRILFIISILVVGSISIVVFSYFYEFVVVKSDSMQEELTSGDVLILRKIDSKCKREIDLLTSLENKVCVFIGSHDKDNRLIKRCCGISGDTILYIKHIEAEKGKLLVDSIYVVVPYPGLKIEFAEHELYARTKYFNEPYSERNTLKDSKSENTFDEYYLYLLGDNQENSFDSYDFGFIPLKLVIGVICFKTGINISRFRKKLHN